MLRNLRPGFLKLNDYFALIQELRIKMLPIGSGVSWLALEELDYDLMPYSTLIRVKTIVSIVLIRISSVNCIIGILTGGPFGL